ncbi:hypothetical protein Tco_1533826 [Tanacetum coccineum]
MHVYKRRICEGESSQSNEKNLKRSHVEGEASNNQTKNEDTQEGKKVMELEKNKEKMEATNIDVEVKKEKDWPRDDWWLREEAEELERQRCSIPPMNLWEDELEDEGLYSDNENFDGLHYEDAHLAFDREKTPKFNFCNC